MEKCKLYDGEEDILLLRNGKLVIKKLKSSRLSYIDFSVKSFIPLDKIML